MLPQIQTSNTIESRSERTIQPKKKKAKDFSQSNSVLPEIWRSAAGPPMKFKKKWSNSFYMHMEDPSYTIHPKWPID